MRKKTTILFTGNRQNSKGNVNSYLFFVIYRPNLQKCATSRVKSYIPAAQTFGSLHVLRGASGFLGGPVDFLIHWPPGPVVATVQCQGLQYDTRHKRRNDGERPGSSYR